MLIGIRWRLGKLRKGCVAGLRGKRRGQGQASSWLTQKQGPWLSGAWWAFRLPWASLHPPPVPYIAALTLVPPHAPRMVSTGKPELGPSHNTGKPGPRLATWAFVPPSSSPPATTPLPPPSGGFPNICLTCPLWSPQTQPTDSEGIGTHPNLCVSSATPCPQTPHPPIHQQPNKPTPAFPTPHTQLLASPPALTPGSILL